MSPILCDMRCLIMSPDVRGNDLYDVDQRRRDNDSASLLIPHCMNVPVYELKYQATRI
jgi:hypothetical protein